MRQIKFLIAILLSSFFTGFSQQDFSGEVKTFLIQNPDIRISIETYKEKDGWTPVIISLGELEIDLWMNLYGEVTEFLLDRDIEWVESLFRIDLTSNKITFPEHRAYAKGEGEDSCSFIVTESNPVRTRILIEGNEITSKLILDGAKKKAELFLFGHRVQIATLGIDIKDIGSGKSEIQLSGPSIRTYGTLIYDRITESIFLKHPWQEEHGITNAWAKRIK